MSAWKANPKGHGQRLSQPQAVVEPQSLTQDELRRENERLREKVANSEKQIADLERQLAGRKKDSTTCSKPAAARRLKPARCRGRRKQRGQPGTVR